MGCGCFRRIYSYFDDLLSGSHSEGQVKDDPVLSILLWHSYHRQYFELTWEVMLYAIPENHLGKARLNLIRYVLLEQLQCIWCQR